MIVNAVSYRKWLLHAFELLLHFWSRSKLNVTLTTDICCYSF